MLELRKRAKWVTCGGTEHLRNEARDPARE
jgi:hypothetical protein